MKVTTVLFLSLYAELSWLSQSEGIPEKKIKAKTF